MVNRYIDEQSATENAYILDLIFVNILDQIFKQTVIETALGDIQDCLHHELRYTVLPSNLEELCSRRQTIHRAYKLVNSHINNKKEKQAFVQLVNINQGNECQEDLRVINNCAMRSSIRRYISRVFSNTSGNV